MSLFDTDLVQEPLITTVFKEWDFVVNGETFNRPPYISEFYSEWGDKRFYNKYVWVRNYLNKTLQKDFNIFDKISVNNKFGYRFHLNDRKSWVYDSAPLMNIEQVGIALVYIMQDINYTDLSNWCIDGKQVNWFEFAISDDNKKIRRKITKRTRELFDLHMAMHVSVNTFFQRYGSEYSLGITVDSYENPKKRSTLFAIRATHPIK